MSSTNKTTYYQLSQYVGTDIINPLTDFNGDNEKIDTALHNIAEAAGSSASDITALTGRVTTAEGKITALENQNGNAVLVTTAQTLSGAINELKSVNDTQNSTLSAHTTSIDNINSKVTAVETEIDEKYLLVGNVNLVNTYVTDSYKNIINDCVTRLKTYISNLADDEFIEVVKLKLWRLDYLYEDDVTLLGNADASSNFVFEGVNIDISSTTLSTIKVETSSADPTATSIIDCEITASGTTFSDLTDRTMNNIEGGFEIKKYKKVG